MNLRVDPSFLQQMTQLLGEAGCRRLMNALDEPSPISVRMNEKAGDIGLDFTQQGGLSASHSPLSISPVPWCTTGRYLSERPSFTFDPLFHAGCYYVQEASSMFLEQVLRQCTDGETPLLVLDLCAAPGGKSTHLRGLLPKGSLLLANEVVAPRAQVLAENLTKWGHPDVIVTRNDPADFASMGETFDLVLVDAPCSGEGMFRKEAEAVSGWSPEAVRMCQQRQRRILADVWPALKPGGWLVYSTCTFNLAEDEENVRFLIDGFDATPVGLNIPESWQITGNLLPGEDFPVYRFFPHLTRGEGFFLAVVRKGERSTDNKERQAISHKCRSHKAGRALRRPVEQRHIGRPIAQWLKDADDYALIDEGGTLFAFRRNYLPLLDEVVRLGARVLQKGVAVAGLKGKDYAPLHALSMSQLLHREAFARAEIDYRQAIAYLRGETLSLSADVEHGMVLLTYLCVPLGFAKNVGSRANNLYPASWRIRKMR